MDCEDQYLENLEMQEREQIRVDELEAELDHAYAQIADLRAELESALETQRGLEHDMMLLEEAYDDIAARMYDEH